MARWLRSVITPGRDRDEGQSLAEYAMILGLVAVACVLALTTLGGAIVASFDAAAGWF